ncbi:MAG: GNAT family N-acetyltransferase [Candidatus Delongbacteria bacterium]|nr:GNAT family N-acetyltransferase [Candidatus Delongbacteria bacterium]MBN2834347.1 GNAT family N-acetyltransferase [Candidatus Delongbacteria bacterium]
MAFNYAEMKLEISSYKDWNVNQTGLTFSEIALNDLDKIYDVYIDSFDGSDARFYEGQTDDDKRTFFLNELGLEDAIACKASHKISRNGEIVGFSLVLPYGVKNLHISCMCVANSLKGQGLGKLMMNFIVNETKKLNCSSLTLGTETEMLAYELYKKSGFEVVEIHNVNE